MNEYLTDSPRFVALFMVAVGVSVVGAFVLTMLYSWLNERHGQLEPPRQWQPVAPPKPAPAAPATQTVNIYVAGDLAINAAPGADLSVTRPARGSEPPAARILVRGPNDRPAALIACDPLPVARPASLVPAVQPREHQYDASGRVAGWAEEW